MVLVMAFSEARGTKQCHVVGTKVLKGTTMVGTGLHPQLIQGLHHGVCLERLLILVSLKVSGTQRHLTLQTGLHSHRLLIYTLVAENHRSLGLRLGMPLQLQHCGSEPLDDAGKFEVFLQGLHTLILFTALWATGKCFVILVSVRGLPDTGSTVVVATGENHRIRVELKADGATQLVDELLLWL